MHNFSKRSPTNVGAQQHSQDACKPQGRRADWLRQPETRQLAQRSNSASAMGDSTSRINRHSTTLSSAAHGQGVPSASKIHAQEKSKVVASSKQKLRLSHWPTVAHRRPSTSIRPVAAARSTGRSFDTTRFHGDQTALGHPGATRALADVSPLIKDDEDIIGILATSDSTQVSMTCQSVCCRGRAPLPVRSGLTNAYIRRCGREMEHVRSKRSQNRCSPGSSKAWLACHLRACGRFVCSCDESFVRCHNGRHPLA